MSGKNKNPQQQPQQPKQQLTPEQQEERRVQNAIQLLHSKGFRTDGGGTQTVHHTTGVSVGTFFTAILVTFTVCLIIALLAYVYLMDTRVVTDPPMPLRPNMTITC